MKTYTVTEGGLAASRQNVFMGQIPKRIIVGMVRIESFNGEVKREESVLFRTQLDRFHRVTRERRTVPVESVQAGVCLGIVHARIALRFHRYQHGRGSEQQH